jgi:antiviral helicase SKI2
MKRAPAAPSSFVRGKSGQVPFWPGGLDESLGLDEDAVYRKGVNELQSIPPGFTRGMHLPGEEGDDPELLNDVQQRPAHEETMVILQNPCIALY